jgi:hypothetical protein
MEFRLLSVLLATALSVSLLAAPAQAALRDRVFVASYGSDSNPCTFGSPCKTFQNALSGVAAGGEITAIDSAGFGPLDITKAVTVTSPNGVEAGIAAAAGGTAIMVDAGPSDVVVLRGLTLDGAGSGAIGIFFNTGAQLEVVNCTVRGYISTGIDIEPASGAASVLITDSVISANGSYDIYLFATAGNIVAAFNRVAATDSGYGIDVDADGAPAEIQIADSSLDNNSAAGLYLAGTGSSSSANAILRNVTINGSTFGIYLNQFANAWLSGVTQAIASGFLSTSAVNITGTGGAAYSDGTNHLMGGVQGGSLATWTKQ